MDRCRLGNQVFDHTADSAATVAVMEAVEKAQLTVAHQPSPTQILRYQVAR